LLATTIGGNLAFIAVACSGFLIFGTQAVMNNYTAMSYETYLRGTAVGIAVTVSRVGGMLGSILIGWTQKMRNAMWDTLLMLALAQLAAACVIALASARSDRHSQTLHSSRPSSAN